MTLTKSRWIEMIGVVIVLGTLIIWQRDLWIFHIIVVDHDTMRIYPLFACFADSIQKGKVLLWDPYLEMGQPFFPISPGMVFGWQPWTLLLIGLGKYLSIGLLYLFQLRLLLDFVLFTTGSYLLFRYLFESKVPAFAAFATMVFSALSSSYLRQSAYVDNALSPLLALSLLKLFEDTDMKYLILSAWLLGITADSYFILTTSVFIIIFLLSLILTRSIAPKQLKVFVLNKSITLIAAGIFILLSFRAFVQAWYLKEFILILRQEVNHGDSSHWADFATLVSPYFFVLYQSIRDRKDLPLVSMGALYIGLLPLWMAAIGVYSSHQRYKKAFLLITGFMALLMLGHHTPIFVFLRLLPPFQIIRNTTDFHVFFILGLCYFVGCGIEVILKQIWHKSNPEITSIIWIAVAIASFAVGIASATNIWINRSANALGISGSDIAIAWQQSWTNIAWFAVGVYCIVWFIKTRSPKLLLASLVFFAAPDLLFAGGQFLKICTQERTTILPQVPQDTLSSDHYSNRRVSLIRATHLYNVATLLREFTAYHYETSGGTHFIELRDSYILMQIHPTGGLDVAAGVSADKLRLVDRAVVMDHDRIPQAMDKVNPKDLENFIFIEENLPKEFKNMSTALENTTKAHPVPGHVQVAAFEANAISLDVDNSTNCLLYYSDAYEGSWQAYVDGIPTRILRANFNFKAVPLIAGKHTVRFEYHPLLYLWSLWLYCTGVVAGIASFIWIKLKAP